MTADPSGNGPDASGFLDRAYGLEGPEATRAFYQDWAASYDAEIGANGYATPGRCAAALAAHAEDLAAPVLDLGCGTGLSGLALRSAGFGTVDGSDFCDSMLDRARAKTGVYRRLIASDLTRPVPANPGDYANVAAVGVFSPSHAPPDLIGAVMALLPPGGCFVFSLNDHTLADPGYRTEIVRLTETGLALPVFDEYGPHLPGKSINAAVIVLRRATSGSPPR